MVLVIPNTTSPPIIFTTGSCLLLWWWSELFTDFHLQCKNITQEMTAYIKFFNKERPAYLLRYLTPKQYKEMYAPFHGTHQDTPLSINFCPLHTFDSSSRKNNIFFLRF
ncbi:MAG: IS3 family transposase [Lachnospiraceae bacterium]|nr:IS3 family transposase [Lachnospiraceae bacterium]